VSVGPLDGTDATYLLPPSERIPHRGLVGSLVDGYDGLRVLPTTKMAGIPQGDRLHFSGELPAQTVPQPALNVLQSSDLLGSLPPLIRDALRRIQRDNCGEPLQTAPNVPLLRALHAIRE
jgi:hypothetical protein